MKQFFSESYTKVCVEALREQLDLRWQGIETYCEKDEIDIYSLVKLYYGLKTDDEFHQEFISVFNSIDISFTQNNKREISVLAGNILAILMERDSFQLFTVLSIICLSKYNIDIVLPEIVERAYKYFGEVSAKIREQEPVYEDVSTKIIEDYANVIKDKSVIDVTQIQELSSVCNSIVTNISLLITNQIQMQRTLEIYREDSNILSWICGGWSNNLNAPLTKRKSQKSVALILAKELADLVTVLPGPYAVKSFLKKMLDLCKPEANTYSLVELVDTLDNDKKQSIIDSYSGIDGTLENTPILYSIKSALEVNEPEVWKHAVSKRMGFDIGAVDNNILEWAELMYLECILVKADCEWVYGK